MKNTELNHTAYYFIELFVLLFGFFLILAFSFQLYIQIGILGAVLLCYIVLGLLHHASSHNLHRKIIVEYILVSAIIFAAFLFLNAGRL